MALPTCFGASSLLLAINVAHDAAHQALTPYRWLNWAVQTFVFALLGANAYLWQMRHVKSHHNLPNVNGCDIDIDDTSFLRLSPNQPRRRYHRYQHLYAPFIFWLVDIHTVFFQDFVYLFKRRLANMEDIRHPKREYVLFFACKLVYLTLMIFLPMAVLDLPWWQIILGWMVMSFIMSTIFISEISTPASWRRARKKNSPGRPRWKATVLPRDPASRETWSASTATWDS